MLNFIWLLVPNDIYTPDAAKEAIAFVSKEKAIIYGLEAIESYGACEKKSSEEIMHIKTEFLHNDECDYCFLATIPFHTI